MELFICSLIILIISVVLLFISEKKFRETSILLGACKEETIKTNTILLQNKRIARQNLKMLRKGTDPIYEDGKVNPLYFEEENK